VRRRKNEVRYRVRFTSLAVVIHYMCPQLSMDCMFPHLTKALPVVVSEHCLVDCGEVRLYIQSLSSPRELSNIHERPPLSDGIYARLRSPGVWRDCACILRPATVGEKSSWRILRVCTSQEDGCILVVAPCRLAWVYRRFRDLYCLHHQGDDLSLHGATTQMHLQSCTCISQACSVC
jgi:hypothetical protein